MDFGLQTGSDQLWVRLIGRSPCLLRLDRCAYLLSRAVYAAASVWSDWLQCRRLLHWFASALPRRCNGLTVTDGYLIVRAALPGG